MLKEKFDLSGKIALVTGSTRGIGKAIGDAFEEYGAKVIRHNTKVCDLSDPAAIDRFFDELEAKGELPDILVANASIQAKIPWTEFPLDEAQKEMQVNFFATLRNSFTPYILPWSVIARAGIPSSLARSKRPPIEAWPSRIEYCVWT